MDSSYRAVAERLSSMVQEPDVESTAVFRAIKTCESGSESRSSQSSEPTDGAYEGEEEEEEEEEGEEEKEEEEETEEEKDEDEEENDHIPRYKHLCAAYTVTSRKDGRTPKQCRNLALHRKNYCWIPTHQSQRRNLGVPLRRKTLRVRKTSMQRTNEVQLAEMRQRIADMEASWNYTFESLNRSVSREREEVDRMRREMARLLSDREGGQNHHRADPVGSTPLEANDEDRNDVLDGLIDDYYLRVNSNLENPSALSNELPVTSSKPNASPAANSAVAGAAASPEAASSSSAVPTAAASPAAASPSSASSTTSTSSTRAEDKDERSLSNVQGGIQFPKMPQSSQNSPVTEESSSSSSSTPNDPASSHSTNEESESTQPPSKPTVEMERQRENDRAASSLQNRPLPLTPSETPSKAITQQDPTSPAPDTSISFISSAIDNISAISDAHPDGGEVGESEVSGPPTPIIIATLPASPQQQQQPPSHEEVQSRSGQADADPQPPSPAAQGQPPPAVPNTPLDASAAQNGEERRTLIEAIERADRVMEGFGIRRS